MHRPGRVVRGLLGKRHSHKSPVLNFSVVGALRKPPQVCRARLSKAPVVGGFPLQGVESGPWDRTTYSWESRLHSRWQWPQRRDLEGLLFWVTTQLWHIEVLASAPAATGLGVPEGSVCPKRCSKGAPDAVAWVMPYC